MNGKITVTGANLLFFTFAVLFIIAQIILTILDVVYGGSFLDQHLYSLLLLNETVIILLPVLLYAFNKRANFREVFRLNKLDMLPALLIVLIALPASFTAAMLNTVVIYFLQFFGNILPQSIPVPQNSTELFIGILIVAVSPAVCEEMMHRGLLLSAYEKRGSYKAILISAVFFGIFHFDITNLLGPVCLGLLFGYYVIKTNSIFAGVLAHFLNNAIAEIFSFLARESSATAGHKVVTAGELGSIAIWGTAGLMVMLVLLKAFRHVTKGKASFKLPVSSAKNDIVSILTHWPVIAVLILYILLTGVYIFSISVA